MKFFSQLKTSEKISLSFSLFSFLMLAFLLFAINIIYFFLWYQDQKEMSFSDMDKNYLLATNEEIADFTGFQAFLLTKNTVIIPENGELICSPGLTKKIHNDTQVLQNRYFYHADGVVYFIYTKYFEGIGQVKVFFDTSSYLHSQMLIIKVSLVIIFLSFFLTFFVGKTISRKLLSQLKSISQEVQNINIEEKLPQLRFIGTQDDEISILTRTLNDSFRKIENQTQSLKQFLTDVSHEFKTPLMVINSKMELSEKKMNSQNIQTEIPELFKTLRNQTKKLNELLETLFFLSRAESGLVSLKSKKGDFGTYLQKTIEIFALEYNDPFLELSFDIQESTEQDFDIPTCDIILRNLFSNAYKFSPKNKKISVFCNEEGFSIENNGEGLSDEEIKKIGQKFYKAERNREGFGIGIFLVKRILFMYNWNIVFSSQVGKSTKVQVFFH